MAVKIRLQRHGKKDAAFFHVVAADGRAPRDGAFIEKLGVYNPNTNPATIDLNFESTLKWLQDGAVPTDTCKAILSYKGILMKKHLLDGVKKGALTEAQVEQKFNKWVQDKEGKISNKKDKCKNSKGTCQSEGCADKDGDGVTDAEDKCPTVAGPKENAGCPWPDTDGDGVLDKDDKCPTVKGTVANQGCPEVSDEVVKKCYRTRIVKAIQPEDIKFNIELEEEFDDELRDDTADESRVERRTGFSSTRASLTEEEVTTLLEVRLLEFLAVTDWEFEAWP